MKYKVTYPQVSKREFQRKKLIRIMRWPYLATAYICPIVNLCIGGPAWSIIVLMGLYMSWNLIFSLDLIEYNRMSQFCKIIVYSCIVLALIDILLIPGWAVDVIVIIGFGALIIASVLLFSDYRKQRKNIMPLFTLIIISLIGTILGFVLYKNKITWEFITLGGVAFALLITFIIILGKDFFNEFKKRFHIK